MRRFRLIPLLLAALLLFACGKPEQQADTPAETAEPEYSIGADDVVLTVGDEPVYAVVYRYHLNDRYQIIREHGLDDYQTYLGYVSDPTVNYLYAYYDTRTEDGRKALCEDVLHELALEAAAIDAGTKAGYEPDISEQSYLLKAEDDAEEKLSDQLKENGGTYESEDAFLKATGFTEERYKEMFVRNMKASIFYNHLLEDYKASHTLTDEQLSAGYERIVKETFIDRYTDGMYSRYLLFYLQGRRTFPSLYIPDDAIFVRLFVKTDPTEEEKAEIAELAYRDFNALYVSEQNEYTVQGTAGDLAVAPKDELIEGLYDAAKIIPIGKVGVMAKDDNGKAVLYMFLRVEGETGIVPIDRYPGMRERIVSQLLGAQYMDTLREKITDPTYAVRSEDVFNAAAAVFTGSQGK